MSHAPRPRPKILEIKAYVAGKSQVEGANRTIKLSSNEGAFGAPPGAKRAYVAAADEFYRYPDGGSVELRAAIAARFGLDAERIVCGSGSDELITNLCLAYGGAGTEIVMSAHGFTVYEIAGLYAGSRVIKAPERNLTADVDALLAAVSPATRLMFLTNPNNPTGSLLGREAVARLRRELPPEVLLVIDAAYAEYVMSEDYDAGVALVEASDNTVMTRTFSKIFGMGGLRLGWAYAPPAVVDVLNRVRSPFNVNAAAQAAGVAALAEPGWVEHGRAHNARARVRLAAALQAAGLKVWPSEGNFLLVDFGVPEQAAAADRFLRSRGIIVRDVIGYGLAHCLRVTIGTDEEIDLVIEALTAFMARVDA